MDHHTKNGIRVDKDAIVRLMLKHAVWLAEHAKRYVDVQSWKEFAKTKVLDMDEEWDAEMEEPEYQHLARTIPIVPIALSPSTRRKRVRPPADRKRTT